MNAAFAPCLNVGDVQRLLGLPGHGGLAGDDLAAGGGEGVQEALGNHGAAIKVTALSQRFIAVTRPVRENWFRDNHQT